MVSTSSTGRSDAVLKGRNNLARIREKLNYAKIFIFLKTMSDKNPINEQTAYRGDFNSPKIILMV